MSRIVRGADSRSTPHLDHRFAVWHGQNYFVMLHRLCAFLCAVWPRLQGVFDTFGVVRDDGEIGAGRLIGFTTPLFPIAERAKGNMIAGGEFLLRQAER